MTKSFLRENIILICILSVILVLCFYDVFFLGKTFKLSTGNPQALMSGPYGQENNKPGYFPVHSTDVPLFEEGIMQFITHSLQSGILPLWNPHQACGTPLVGMMHTGIFFPLNLILYLLPNIIAWDVLIFFRFLLSGLFTYWFMRTLHFKKLPSLTAAVAFMISAPMVFIHWSTVHVDLLLPLLLLALEQLIKNPKPQQAAVTAAVVALTCFAGNPEHVFLVNAYGFLFFCFRYAMKYHRQRQLCQTAFSFAGAYLLGAGLAAIVLFPFLQNWMYEFWHAHSDYIGMIPEGKNIRTQTLINFIIPHFFQKEIVTLSFERSTFWGHIGIIPLGLVILGLVSKQKRGLNYFFVLMAIVIFMKSYVDFPVTNWIGWLPGFRHCRFTHHTQHLFAFSIAVLAGMGMRYFLSQKPCLRVGAFYGGLLITLIGLALFHDRNTVHAALASRSCLQGLGILIIFMSLLAIKNAINKKGHACKKTISIYGIILLAAMGLELFLYIPRGGRVNRFNSFPQVPYIKFLKQMENKNGQGRSRVYGTFWTLCPNTASGYGIDDLGIMDGLLPKRYVHFINKLVLPNYFRKGKTTSAFWIMPVSFSGDTRPFLNILNLRYTTAPPAIEQLFPAVRNLHLIKAVYDNEARVYADPDALPRAFIVHKAVFEPSEQHVIEVMKKIKAGLKAVAVIQHMAVPELEEQLRDTPLISQSTASILSYRPNTVALNVHMTNPGFLILADSYHPDWRCFVNGKETKIFLTDALIRSVFLPAGDHTVVFRFQPIWFYTGAFVSLISVIIAGGLFLLNKKQSNT